MLSVNSTGLTRIQRKEFDAFGNGGSTMYSPMGYAGQYHDYETGFIYLRARYYSPAIGRFINEDPIRDGLNWYVYTNNNPINFIDPSGLDAIVITSTDSVGSSGIGLGHTSVIAQDENGVWHYYYWGSSIIIVEPVPDEAMESLFTFNAWLQSDETKPILQGTTDTYERATYIEGDFSKSVEYYYEIQDACYIEEFQMRITWYGFIDLKKILTNTKYNLINNNCVTTSIDGLEKGTLANGKSFSELNICNSIIPNRYAKNIAKAIGNYSFKSPANRGDK